MIEGLQFLSASRTGDVYGEFTRGVRRYQHEWREGPYQASFRFEVNDDPEKVSITDIRHWFRTRLMTQIQVKYNNVEVWRGWIGKMTINSGGQLATKDAMSMVNAAKCSFQFEHDNHGTITVWTTWFANQKSLKLYGNFEKSIRHNGTMNGLKALEILGYDEEGDPIYSDYPVDIVRPDDDPDYPGMPWTEPEDKAQVAVSQGSAPRAKRAAGDPDKEWLDVTVYGAMQLADKILLSDGPFGYQINMMPEQTEDIAHGNKLRQVADSSDYVDVNWADYKIDTGTGERDYTVTDEILRLLDVVAYQAELYGGEPLLWPVSIANNTRLTLAGVDSVMGLVKRLKELANLRDMAGRYYKLHIRPDGGVIYGPIDTDQPMYKLYEAPEGMKFASGNTRPTWDAQPGLVRVIDTNGLVDHVPDTWLGDSALQFSPSVRMREGADSAEFGDEEYSIDQFWAAIAANKSRVKRRKEAKNSKRYLPGRSA